MALAESLKNLKPRLLVSCACLLLLLEMAVLPTSRWVEDEGWNSDVSITWVKEGHIRMSSFPADQSSLVDTRPPLVPITIGTVFRLFGFGVIQARLSSMLAGLLMVIVVFLLGCEVADAWIGGVAALLASADPFVFLASRTARPEVHTALFCTAAVLMFMVAQRRNRPWFSLGSGIAVAVATNYHPLALGFVPAIALLAFSTDGIRALRRLHLWTFGTGFVLAMLPFLIWIRWDATHWMAFRETWTSRATASYGQKLSEELGRYSDFIGLNAVKAGLPFRFPLRVHIAVIIIAALVVLFRYRRRLAIQLSFLIGTNVLWWTYQVNKSSRYFAVLVPLLSLAVAAAAAALIERRKHLAATFAVIVLFLGSQVAGNAWLLYRFRRADYPAVAGGLQALIPPGSSAYGIVTFFTALPGRTYVSYDRTPFEYAINSAHVQYLILYDRVMMHGSTPGEDTYRELREQETDFVRKNGAFVGNVANDFYGDLQVYKVAANSDRAKLP
jgi:hypothetical protein